MKNVVVCFIILCCSYQLSAQKAAKKQRVYKAWVKMSNTDVHKGYLIQLKDSSIVVTDLKGSASQEFLITSIEQLKFQRKGKMGRSILIGAGTGLVVGAIGGLVSGDDDPGWFSMTAEEKSVTSGILLLPIGAGVGAIVGTGKVKYEIAGKQENYEQHKTTLAQYLKN